MSSGMSAVCTPIVIAMWSLSWCDFFCASCWPRWLSVRGSRALVRTSQFVCSLDHVGSSSEPAGDSRCLPSLCQPTVCGSCDVQLQKFLFPVVATPNSVSADNFICRPRFTSLGSSRIHRVLTDSSASTTKVDALSSCKSVLIVSTRFSSALGTSASSVCLFRQPPFCRRFHRHHRFTWVASGASPRVSSLFELDNCLVFIGHRPRLVQLRRPPSHVPLVRQTLREELLLDSPESSTSASVVPQPLPGGSVLTRVVR